jgi:hypothetical protein
MENPAKMTRDERHRLVANLAAVIDDVYSVSTRPKERRLALVARYVDRACYLGWRSRGGSIDEIITGYST